APVAVPAALGAGTPGIAGLSGAPLRDAGTARTRPRGAAARPPGRVAALSTGLAGPGTAWSAGPGCALPGCAAPTARPGSVGRAADGVCGGRRRGGPPSPVTRRPPRLYPGLGSARA